MPHRQAGNGKLKGDLFKNRERGGDTSATCCTVGGGSLVGANYSGNFLDIMVLKQTASEEGNLGSIRLICRP